MATDHRSDSCSSTLFDDTDLRSSSSRMSPGSSLLIPAATLRSSSILWQTSATGGPTGFWTRATSDFHRLDGGYSLSLLLMPNVPERFSMTARTAAWILRRSYDRAEPLWPEVEAALISVLQQSSDLPTLLAQTPSSAPTGIRSRSPRPTRSSSSSDAASPEPTSSGTGAPTPSSPTTPDGSTSRAISPLRSSSSGTGTSSRSSSGTDQPTHSSLSEPEATSDSSTSRSPSSSSGRASGLGTSDGTGARSRSLPESVETTSTSSSQETSSTDGTISLLWGETEEDESDETEPMELESGLSLPPSIVARITGETLPPVRLRRLTPTECERLQGFPDGWTIPSPEALTRWGRSISTPLDGTSSDALARSLSSRGSARASAQS